jgi:hypothetical protein
MLVGERIIYLQLQKTGSTRITDLIQATVGAEERSKHDRIRRVDLADPEIAAKYLLGSVRSPWSYYVSLWAFGCHKAGGIFERTTGLARHDTPPALKGTFGHKSVPLTNRDRKARKRAAHWLTTYTDADDRDAFREWIRLLNHPKYRADVGEGYGKSALSAHAGLLTYRWFVLFCLGMVPGEPHEGLDDLDAIRRYADENLLCQGMVRMEHLADDLEKALLEAGYDLTDDQRALIHGETDAKGENRSRHRPTAWYYDDDTRDLVARRDRFIIERYGYELA